MDGEHCATAGAVRQYNSNTTSPATRRRPPSRSTAHGQQRRQAAAVTAIQGHAAPKSALIKSAADPEAVKAEKGLNKWGAFDGGSERGTGSFGFGPLLHHHIDDIPKDPFESTRLLMNDPISFNPLNAISWAGLDLDDGFEDDTTSSHHDNEYGIDRKGADDYRINNHANIRHPSPSVTPRNDSPSTRFGGESYTSESSSVSSVASGTTANSNTSSTTYSSAGFKVDPSLTDSPSTIIAPIYTSTPTVTSSLTTDMIHHQHPYPNSHLLRRYPPPPALTHPVPPILDSHPQTRPLHDADLLLCLGPHCNAKFRTEAELHAHFKHEHSYTCNWASCKAASFNSHNALTWHVKVEHLLTCPVVGCCDTHFTSKEQLGLHVRAGSARSSSADTMGKTEPRPRHPVDSQIQQPQPQRPYRRRRSKSPSPILVPDHHGRQPRRARH